MRLREGHTCDPGEVRKEWGTGENDRVMHEDEKRRKNIPFTFPTATARRREKIQKYR